MTVREMLAPFAARLPRPNYGQDWPTLVRQLERDFDLLGNCFVWTPRGNLGNVAEVYRLDPARLVPLPGGGFRYTEGGLTHPLMADDVVGSAQADPVPDAVAEAAHD